MRGENRLKPLTILLVATLLFMPVLLAAHPSKADEIIDYPLVSESVTKGTSSGFSAESAGDSVSDTKTEANNGTTTVMMLPFNDVAVDWDYVYYDTPPCPVGLPTANHTGALTCPYPGAMLEPDDNTSYIAALVNHATDDADLDQFNLLDPLLPVSTVITGVSVFVWARMNETDTHILSFTVEDSSGACSYSYPVITQAFANYTDDWPLSCDGDAWTSTNLADLDLNLVALTAVSIDRHVTATYAGVIVTYQTPYWLDISSTINVPTEQVSQVEIFLSCSLAGDTEGFTMQINGLTVAAGLCIAPYVDTRYLTDARGDVIIRTYSNPDPTQTTYSIDLLVARVTITDTGGTLLRPPIPFCQYNPLLQVLDCVDVQDYYELNVVWVRWQLDDGSTVRTDPNGRVSLPVGDSPLEVGTRYHIVKATAVYLSGAEVAMQMPVDCPNGVRALVFIAGIGFIFILLMVYREKRKRRYR
jgi:hypothetical protein